MPELVQQVAMNFGEVKRVTPLSSIWFYSKILDFLERSSDYSNEMKFRKRTPTKAMAQGLLAAAVLIIVVSIFKLLTGL